jgi:hypothetical protein
MKAMEGQSSILMDGSGLRVRPLEPPNEVSNCAHRDKCVGVFRVGATPGRLFFDL